MPAVPRTAPTLWPSTVRYLAPLAVVALAGPMTDADESEHRRGIDAALTLSPAVLIADLSRATLEVASLPLLSRLHGRVTATGARFAVSGLTGRARELLSLTEQTRDLAVYPALPTPPPWSEGPRAAYA